MNRSDIPDVLGMKLPAAVSLLKAAGLSYTENILRPVGKFAKTEGTPRVVRQRNGEDGTVFLDVCNVEELLEERFEQK